MQNKTKEQKIKERGRRGELQKKYRQNVSFTQGGTNFACVQKMPKDV